MGRKFTIFPLFYFVFEGKFQVLAPRGGLYSEGRFNGGLLRYDFGGLIFGGPYTWRGYFRNFAVMQGLFWGETIMTKCLGMGWL